MNERIRELALQAKLRSALLLHHYSKVDALTDTEQDELEQIEKFAELIVRECAMRVDNILREKKDGGGTMGDDIKEYFGVGSA